MSGKNRRRTGRRRLIATHRKPAATGVGEKDGRRRRSATIGRRRLIATHLKPAATGAGEKDRRGRRSAPIGRRRLILTHTKPAATRGPRLAVGRLKAAATGLAGKGGRRFHRAATGCRRLVSSFLKPAAATDGKRQAGEGDRRLLAGTAAGRQTKVAPCCRMSARRRLAAVCRLPAAAPHLRGPTTVKAVAGRRPR